MYPECIKTPLCVSKRGEKLILNVVSVFYKLLSAPTIAGRLMEVFHGCVCFRAPYQTMFDHYVMDDKVGNTL